LNLKIKFFRSSNGQDSSSAEIEEDIMSNKKDSNDVLESLRQVQEHVTALKASIGGMNEESKKSKESKKSLETPS
jgi:septal ring factor EnvC (AmiA/AmiB activator)